MESALRCYEKYSINGQKYQHKIEIQNYILESLPQSILTKCSIRKIIRLVNNILKLNMFECCLLCWMVRKAYHNVEARLKELQDQYDSSGITVLTEGFDKSVLLYLLLNGYHVKSNFTANGSEVDIDPILLENVKNFHQIYSQWKPQKSLKNVTLNEINKIFQNWNQQKGTFINKAKIDYNRIVDRILFLSKTYNVGQVEEQRSLGDTNTFNNKTEKNNKKRKLNEQESQQKIRYCEEKDIQLEHSPMKNSVSNKVPWFEDDRPIETMNLRRSTRTLTRSIFELKQDRQDLNPNDLFQSVRSHGSNHDNMLSSLRNTTNMRFFNMANTSMNQSFGFGNIFRSSLDDDNDVLNDRDKSDIRKSKKKGETVPSMLKPTTSCEEIK